MTRTPKIKPNRNELGSAVDHWVTGAVVSKNYKSKFIDAYKIQEKQKRSELLNELRAEISENYETEILTSVIVSDATKSIEVILKYITESIKKGLTIRENEKIESEGKKEKGDEIENKDKK